MKRIKKPLSVLLVILMLVTAVPLNGFVDVELPDFFSYKAKAETSSNEFLTSGFCGDTSEGGDGKNISWTLDENGVLTITGTGEMAPEAFEFDLRIKEVVISDGITNISDYCFNQCSNIVKVTMGDDVITINEAAFYSCNELLEVVFSDSLSEIGLAAFQKCGKLAQVKFPDSLTLIGNRAFGYCDAIINLDMPDSLTTLYDYVFMIAMEFKILEFQVHCSI